MRLWSLHPRYLDSRGLVALWREGLLAQRALESTIGGYSRHPQLERFKAQAYPLLAIACYLDAVLEESRRRGYKFDQQLIRQRVTDVPALWVTEGQLRYELGHLSAKLGGRAPSALEQLAGIDVPEPHPLFFTVPGPVESWERTAR